MIKHTIGHYVRTHYWYAFVADCSLEMYQHRVPPLYYNLTFLNLDSTHLPADEEGLWEIHFFNVVVMLFGLCVVLFRMWRTVSETKSIHLVVLLLLL
jgi:hypothetical protein